VISSRRGSERSQLLKASPAMFQSRFLDRLTRVHPATPVAVFPPAVIAFAAAGVTDFRTYSPRARSRSAGAGSTPAV